MHTQLLRKLNSRSNTGTETKAKTIYLPYQISYINGIVKDLPKKYGMNSLSGSGVMHRGKGKSTRGMGGSRGTESELGDFADLN